MFETTTFTRHLRSAALLVTVLVALTVDAAAQGIIQPASASTSLRTLFARGAGGIGNIAYLANRSGFSIPYVSGVDEFDVYVSTNSHRNSSRDMLLGNSNGQNQPNGIVNLGETITLDLGDLRAIDALGFWSVRVGSEAITAFRLHADDDDSFTNGTRELLGSFAPAASQGGQAFSFAPVVTRFVHLEVTGHGGGSFLKVAEIAFRDAGLHMTFNSGLDIAPGGSTTIRFHAPQRPNELYLPIVSCTLGSTPVAGAADPLPVALDACTDLYLSGPIGQSLFALTPTGALFDSLDANGQATGTVSMPATLPSGLGLPIHFCFIAFDASGSSAPEVSPLGTLTLN